MYLYRHLLDILLLIRPFNLGFVTVPVLFLRRSSTAHICHSYIEQPVIMSSMQSPSISNILYLPRPRGCEAPVNPLTPTSLHSLWMFSSLVMFVQIITHHLIHDVSHFVWLHLYTWPRQLVFILDEIFSCHLGFELSLWHNSADK